MKWKKYTIETTTAAEDFMSSMLMELGIEGIEIEDNIPLSKEDQADMFIDFLPELPPDEGKSHVSFYVEEDGSDQTELLKQVKIGLENLRSMVEVGSGVISSSETEDLDWINNWKKYFNPIEVGEKLLIRPSWRDDYDAGNRKVLNIDPGLAFGTGGHETTRLCLEMCEKYLKAGDSVLDVGCGSGILGIATLLLGADRAVGVDIDETAVRTAAENAEINGVADRFTAICGSFTDKVEGKYDIVLANIVADAIMFLSKGIKDFMKDDAVYIMSGIIDTRAEEVKASVSQYFDIIEEHLDNGWACFAARRAAVPRS